MSRKPKIYEVATPRGTEYRVMGYVRGERKYLGQYKSRAKAERMAKTLTRHVGRKGKTLEDFGEDFLKEREKSKAHRSARNDRNRWHNHIAGTSIEGMELRRIKPKHVKQWLDGVQQKGLAHGTVMHCRNLMSACMREAVRAGHIDVNPVREISVSKPVEPELWTWLTLGEIDALLSSPKHTHKRYGFTRSLYTVAIYTGLRKGELLGLRWEDLVLSKKGASLTVRRTNQGQPKSQSAYRTLPLFEPARKALLAWKKSGDVEPIKGYVWPGDSGGARGRHDRVGWTAFRKSLDLYREHPDPAHGLYWVRFHDLRHTCASHLRQGSWGEPWTLDEIRRLLGHSDIKLTERYAHLGPDYLSEVAAKKMQSVNKNLLTAAKELKP